MGSGVTLSLTEFIPERPYDFIEIQLKLVLFRFELYLVTCIRDAFTDSE